MQRTTNYGLCQYEGSDKTSYLVNYNDDMLKIDTAIKGAADDAAAAQTKADSADGKADVNAGNISSLNTQINGESGIAADVVTLQGSMNTVTSLIGNGEPTTTDKTLIGAINELNSDIGSVNTVLAGAHVLRSIHRVIVAVDTTETISDQLDRLATAINNYFDGLDASAYAIPVAFGFGNGWEGMCKMSNSLVFHKGSSLTDAYIDGIMTIIASGEMDVYEGRVGSQKRLNKCAVTSAAVTVTDSLSTAPIAGSYVDFMVFGSPV